MENYGKTTTVVSFQGLVVQLGLYSWNRHTKHKRIKTKNTKDFFFLYMLLSCYACVIIFSIHRKPFNPWDFNPLPCICFLNTTYNCHEQSLNRTH